MYLQSAFDAAVPPAAGSAAAAPSGRAAAVNARDPVHCAVQAVALTTLLAWVAWVLLLVGAFLDTRKYWEGI